MRTVWPRIEDSTGDHGSADQRLSPESGSGRPPSADHRARHARAYRVEVVATLALVAAIVAFAGLAVLAHATPYFWFDPPIAQAIQALPWSGLRLFLLAINWLGLPPESNIIFGGLILVLALVGRRWEAAGLLVAALGSIGLWYLLAPLVARPRPSAELVQVAGPIAHGSFPSGHVTNLTAIFGYLWFLTYATLRPSWPRALLLILLAVPILSIGLARVYMGQHWPSDVLGGYLLGGIWLAVTIWLYRRVKQYATHGRAFRRSPREASSAPLDSP